jgi:hypothetical protein
VACEFPRTGGGKIRDPYANRGSWTLVGATLNRPRPQRLGVACNEAQVGASQSSSRQQSVYIATTYLADQVQLLNLILPQDSTVTIKISKVNLETLELDVMYSKIVKHFLILLFNRHSGIHERFFAIC